MEKILIAGGSGLVGQHLCNLLQQKGGYEVSLLSRNPKSTSKFKQYFWDVEKIKADDEAFHNADVIVNLAGANVAGQRWTEAYKNEIIQSRLKSTNLLFEKVKTLETKPKLYLTASAIGYYDSKQAAVGENDSAGKDFLSQVCLAWEEAAAKFSTLDIPVGVLRIGLVMSKSGGFLEKMQLPLQLGLLSPMGTGLQMMSWIHIDDLCNMFVWLIENPNKASFYNAVAPQTVNNKVMMKTLAKVNHKPFFLPNIPEFALKLALGEMSTEVLSSHAVSAKKILDAGFNFQFPSLEAALKNIYAKN